MRNIISLFLVFLSLTSFAHTFPAGFVPLQIATGLNPTSLTITDDGRVFLAEKTGEIRLILNDELLVESVIEIPVDSRNERGLQGICLDPNFDQNGFLYAYYAVPNENRNRVSRFTIAGLSATLNSELILLELDASINDFHNGGALLFGLDGMLYISVGDTGKEYDVSRLDTFWGKILRIRADGSIPEDNPFYDKTFGNYRAIYASGFRNPFQMTQNPDNGDIFIGDVGNATWEEINKLVRGAHYGWNGIEGKRVSQTPPENYKDPIHAYSHATGCAITGLTFCPANTPNLPSNYPNKLYAADYCKGFIRRLSGSTASFISNFATETERPVGLKWSKDGALYMISRGILTSDLNDAPVSGSIWKIFYTGSNAPYVFQNPKDVFLSLSENAQFSIASVGEEPLYYEWYKNDVLIPGADQDTLLLTSPSLADSGAIFKCVVSNALGIDTSLEAMLRITANQRPVIDFILPLLNQQYSGGDTLFFAGQASDPESGPIDPQNLTWRVVFHHDTHAHPALDPTSGLESGFYVAPTLTEVASNVWYRVYLQAQDPEGLYKTEFRDVHPRLSTTNIYSQPNDTVAVLINSTPRMTPTKMVRVTNVQQNIGTTPGFFLNDSIYFFEKWSNGATEQSISFPAGSFQSITAQYRSEGLSNGIGLIGRYYQEGGIPSFQTNPLLERLDSTVNFDWSLESPDPVFLNSEYFAVRWAGYIEPITTGITTFHLTSNDGSRLYVDNKKIIDSYDYQDAIERTGAIFLEKGKKYPILIEYFDATYYASCVLAWSSPLFERGVVPKQQLFPTNFDTSPQLAGRLWLDSNGNRQKDTNEKSFEEATIILRNVDFNTISAITTADTDGNFLLPASTGNFIIQVNPNAGNSLLEPGLGLDGDGKTLPFSINSKDSLFFDLAFQPIAKTAIYAKGSLKMLKRYPNPGVNELFVEFTSQTNAGTTILLFDESGRTVIQEEMTATNGWQKYQLDTQALPSGNYQIVIRNESGESGAWWIKH